MSSAALLSAVIPAGTVVTASVSGSFGSVRHNAATFREAWLHALLAQALDVQTLDVTARPWLERILDADFVEEPYTASLRVKTLAPQTETNLIAVIRTAAESAGSYTPAVTLTSRDQPGQRELPPVGGLLGGLADGLAATFRGIGQTVEAVPGTAKLLIVGIVAIVVVVGFGPNVGRVLRSVGR